MISMDIANSTTYSMHRVVVSICSHHLEIHIQGSQNHFYATFYFWNFFYNSIVTKSKFWISIELQN